MLGLFRKYLLLRLARKLVSSDKKQLTLNDTARTFKRLAKRIAVLMVLLIVLFITGVILLTAATIRDERFAPPIPGSWRQTRQSGSVSSLCLEGPSVCGKLTRYYSTGTGGRQAMDHIILLMQRDGWSITKEARESDGLAATAERTLGQQHETAIIRTSEREAVIEYRKQRQ